jgi:putative transposase
MKRANTLKARQARIRKDWAHRTTTAIARRFGTVVVEKLRTKNMTRSAKGTLEAPGVNVAAKSGLNRAILNVAWRQIETMLAYKANTLIRINPAHTSQACSACGSIDKLNRKSQAVFSCLSCAHTENADLNAAKTIFNRGNTAVLDVEGKQSVAPLKRQLSAVAA